MTIHPSHLMMPPRPPVPPWLGHPNAVHCDHCHACTDSKLAEPCPANPDMLANAPSGLPQDDAPGLSEAEYKEFTARIKASQVQDLADEEHDADLVWLLHCVRDVARTKKTRKQDAAAFNKSVQRLVIESAKYTAKHY